MFFVNPQKPQPEIRILDSCKSFSLPAFKPILVDGIDNIRGITIDVNLSIIPLNGLQSDNDGKKFHAVIRSQAKAS